MRRPDWLPRLLQYVEAVRAVPFHPVTHNCALFVAGAIREMRGDDAVSALGIKLQTADDVSAALSARDGVRGICSEYLGEMKPPRLARRGDVVVKRGGDGDTVGICMGTHALFLAPNGLQPRKLADCEGCWSVE